LTDIIRLDAKRAELHIEDLTDILCDVVDSGASVSFLPPLPRGDARAFWRKIIAEVADGTRILLAARIDGKLSGTVQLSYAGSPNQAHRGEVAKLLVHSRARRRGVARALMQRLEDEALLVGRSLLTLDTRAGDAAEPLYRSMGYQFVGLIPRYARNGDGGLDATAVFYKELGSPQPNDS